MEISRFRPLNAVDRFARSAFRIPRRIIKILVSSARHSLLGAAGVPLDHMLDRGGAL